MIDRRLFFQLAQVVGVADRYRPAGDLVAGVNGCQPLGSVPHRFADQHQYFAWAEFRIKDRCQVGRGGPEISRRVSKALHGCPFATARQWDTRVCPER